MPYFTLEYRNQQVTQIQGKSNRQEVPEKIKQAVRQWQENLQCAKLPPPPPVKPSEKKERLSPFFL